MTYRRFFAFSRRCSSICTAMRKNSALVSPSSSTASIASNVPSGKRPGVCSELICFRPIEEP